MNKRGAKAVTECPICGKPVHEGMRVRCTFSWEGAELTKRRWNYEKHEWVTRNVKGLKGKTRLVCRECAENAASMLGIERPEEVVA